MEIECQACGYTRKPSDQAPDWQCPACGKAYAKTTHDSQDLQAIQASSSPFNSSRQPGATYIPCRMPSDANFRASGQTQKKRGWVEWAVVGFLVILGISIIANPSATSTFLLHGDAGATLIYLLPIVGLVAVFRQVRAGVDPDDRWAQFTLVSKLVALILAIVFLAIAVPFRNRERTETVIQLHGQRAIADVVRIYTGSCGNRGRGPCAIDVEYAYAPVASPDGTVRALRGHGELGTSNHPDDPNIVHARTSHHVPIAYEVGHPEVSALNLDDDVFRVNHGQRYVGRITSAAKFFLGGYLAAMTIIGLSLWMKLGNSPSSS